MLFPILVTLIIILGAIVYYIYYLAPRLNPLNRAQGFIDQNMFDEAVVEYKKMLESNPANSVVHYKLGELYFANKMIDQGVLHFEEIIKINKFSHEVDKFEVLRQLAEAYLSREETEKAFNCYYEIARAYPGDIEAQYQVGFISLGQEVFDLAYKSFDRLLKSTKDKSFEMYFGAGMASYQNHKTTDAEYYFKEALIIEPLSDIGNISMAFTLQRKKDFSTAINYAKAVAENSKDKNAIIIAKRLLAFLYVQARKPENGIKYFEELLEMAGKSEHDDEVSVLLYDLGFASIRAEKTQQAYDYWNQLYQLDRNYKDVQKLTTLLRKEMDVDPRKKTEPLYDSVMNYIDDWIKDAFPENFIWNICGLKSGKRFDLKSIIVRARVSETKSSKQGASRDDMSYDDTERMDVLCETDTEKFRIIASRMIQKLGYTVDEILLTYREADGVDFMVHSNEDGKKVLVWVRRWKGTNVGEIPLRNFAQAINDAKAVKGLFVTTSNLTPAAEGTLNRLSKITVIYPDQVGSLLEGLI